MLISDNDITGGQSFTVRLRRTDDGQFAASTPNAKELGETLSDDRQSAVRHMNDRIAQYISNGYRVAPATRTGGR